MPKSNTMITLDVELKEQAQTRGINISELTETALRDLFAGGNISQMQLEVQRLRNSEAHLTEELRITSQMLHEKTSILNSLLQAQEDEETEAQEKQKKELVIESKIRIEQKFKELDSVMFVEKQLWLDTDKPVKWDEPSDNLSIWENARSRFIEAGLKIGYYDMVLYHDYKRLNKNGS